MNEFEDFNDFKNMDAKEMAEIYNHYMKLDDNVYEFKKNIIQTIRLSDTSIIKKFINETTYLSVSQKYNFLKELSALNIERAAEFFLEFFDSYYCITYMSEVRMYMINLILSSYHSTDFVEKCVSRSIVLIEEEQEILYPIIHQSKMYKKLDNKVPLLYNFCSVFKDVASYEDKQLLVNNIIKKQFFETAKEIIEKETVLLDSELISKLNSLLLIKKLSLD